MSKTAIHNWLSIAHRRWACETTLGDANRPALISTPTEARVLLPFRTMVCRTATVAVLNINPALTSGRLLHTVTLVRACHKFLRLRARCIINRVTIHQLWISLTSLQVTLPTARMQRLEIAEGYAKNARESSCVRLVVSVSIPTPIYKRYVAWYIQFQQSEDCLHGICYSLTHELMLNLIFIWSVLLAHCSMSAQSIYYFGPMSAACVTRNSVNGPTPRNSKLDDFSYQWGNYYSSKCSSRHCGNWNFEVTISNFSLHTMRICSPNPTRSFKSVHERQKNAGMFTLYSLVFRPTCRTAFF